MHTRAHTHTCTHKDTRCFTKVLSFLRRNHKKKVFPRFLLLPPHPFVLRNSSHYRVLVCHFLCPGTACCVPGRARDNLADEGVLPSSRSEYHPASSSKVLQKLLGHARTRSDLLGCPRTTVVPFFPSILSPPDTQAGGSMHKNVHTGTDNRILNHSVLELPVGTFMRTNHLFLGTVPNSSRYC